MTDVVVSDGRRDIRLSHRDLGQDATGQWVAVFSGNGMEIISRFRTTTARHERGYAAERFHHDMDVLKEHGLTLVSVEI
jgi:hydrogenase maturation factor